jgi:long-chain acyl-CoA synthetase
MCKGYYKRPDIDKEAFTADGFFKTGDLAPG